MAVHVLLTPMHQSNHRMAAHKASSLEPQIFGCVVLAPIGGSESGYMMVQGSQPEIIYI